MRFCLQSRSEYLRDWHPWFAWYPVCTAPYQYCWLEKVQRKGNDRFAVWVWEYKEA